MARMLKSGASGDGKSGRRHLLLTAIRTRRRYIDWGIIASNFHHIGHPLVIKQAA